MKLGLHYWSYSIPADPAAIAPTLAETARIAEDAGVASFTALPWTNWSMRCCLPARMASIR